MTQFMNLSVDEIVMDTKTQSRVTMDLGLVEEYAEAMMDGDTFPAIVCYQEEAGAEMILADGWYRTMAAKQAGLGELLAEVMQGGLDDAILHAAGANAQHGLQRSDADKRKAVKMLLGHDRWKYLSSRQIADAANVSKTLVNVVRGDGLAARPTQEGTGGTVIGKDGVHYPAEHKKKAPAKVERGALDVLKDMSKLYLELPREPNDAVVEMSSGGECLSAGRAKHMAWWLETYATIVKDYTEDEDIVIEVPDEVTQ